MPLFGKTIKILVLIRKNNTVNNKYFLFLHIRKPVLVGMGITGKGMGMAQGM